MALTDNILAYYKLDDNGNDSASTKNLTGQNSPTFAAAKINDGTSLNGSNQFWTAGNVMDLSAGAYTMAAWVKISNKTGWHFISGKSNSSGGASYEMRTQVTTGVVNLNFTQSGGASDGIFGNTNICDNAWHHVVGVRDGTHVKLYVDGVSDATDITDNNRNCSNSLDFTLGADSGGAHFYLIGMIDEVGVWSRALSSAEVTTLYNSGSGLAYPFTVNTTTNQTVTGKARIQATTNQTITGKARVQETTNQTVTGKARVTASTSQTITGKGRIQETSTQTVTGIARIQKSTSKTITGISRITASTSQTITGKANIKNTTNKTITGKGRIAGNTSNQTITGKAKILKAPWEHASPQNWEHQSPIIWEEKSTII